MAAPVAALDAGAAWFSGDADVSRGKVCGVFGRACYLRFGDRLLALCRADVASGPLHLRIPALPALTVGDAVVSAPGRLRVPSVTIHIPPDRRWAPDPVTIGDLLGKARSRAEVRWSGPSHTGLDGIVEPARELLARGDLVGLARLVGGRGPGLTPAGDDLLAGVLVIDALLHPDEDAARQAAAHASPTTDVAAAFLRWAVRGQCIAPFHAVMTAMAAGLPDQESAARAALMMTGASSGEALLLGLDLALAAATATALEPATATARAPATTPRRATAPRPGTAMALAPATTTATTSAMATAPAQGLSVDQMAAWLPSSTATMVGT
jgi:Protein of unknown function (DUF2877)